MYFIDPKLGNDTFCYYFLVLSKMFFELRWELLQDQWLTRRHVSTVVVVVLFSKTSQLFLDLIWNASLCLSANLQTRCQTYICINVTDSQSSLPSMWLLTQIIPWPLEELALTSQLHQIDVLCRLQVVNTRVTRRVGTEWVWTAIPSLPPSVRTNSTTTRSTMWVRRMLLFFFCFLFTLLHKLQTYLRFRSSKFTAKKRNSQGFVS